MQRGKDCMGKINIINGAYTEFDLKKINEAYASKGIALYDDEENLDLAAVQSSIAENARVIIIAHGSLDGDALRFELTASDFESFNDKSKASERFKQFKKPINIELFTCGSGGAIQDAKALPTGSTLITFTGDKPLQQVIEKLLIASATFVKNDNPFIMFIGYLLTNPNTNSFAISLKEQSMSFTSAIEDIKSYSLEGMRAWQLSELTRFHSFLKKLKDEITPANLQINIKVALALFDNAEKIKAWLEQFDIKLYKEEMLRQTVEYKQDDMVIHLLEDNDININAGSSGRTPTYVAALDNSKVILKALLEKGADSNVLWDGSMELTFKLALHIQPYLMRSLKGSLK